MSEVVIAGIGLVTPVGLTAAASTAAIRAGIPGFAELDDFYCEPPALELDEPEPLIGARVAGLPDETMRWPLLLVAALQDLLDSSQLPRGAAESAQLIIVRPDASRPGPPPEGPEALAVFLLDRAGARFAGVELVEGGHSAGMTAIERARDLLASSARSHCIVACADSYHQIETLEWLDDTYRLRSTRNREGFIPGEVGCALLFQRAGEPNGLPPLAVVHPMHRSMESSPVVSGEPSSAAGLCQVIEDACRQAGVEAVDWCACDLNGERYRSFEWGLARVRSAELLAPLAHTWHPADCVGDVGTASGLLLASVVARSFERGYAPHNRCLVWTGSEDGTRAALFLSSP